MYGPGVWMSTLMTASAAVLCIHICTLAQLHAPLPRPFPCFNAVPPGSIPHSQPEPEPDSGELQPFF